MVPGRTIRLPLWAKTTRFVSAFASPPRSIEKPPKTGQMTLNSSSGPSDPIAPGAAAKTSESARKPASPTIAVHEPAHHCSQTLDVGSIAIGDDLAAVGQIVGVAAASGAKLVVLPELTGHEGGILRSAFADRPERAVAASDAAVRAIRDALTGTDCVAVTSVVDIFEGGICHSGVVITSDGISLRQRQRSDSPRHAAWLSRFGSSLEFIDTEWGRCCVLPGDDLKIAVIDQMCAAASADLIAIPAAASSDIDTELVAALVRRTGIPVVYATRHGSSAVPTIVSPQIPAGLRSPDALDGDVDVSAAPKDQPIVWGVVSLGHPTT